MAASIAGRYEVVRTLGQGSFGRTFLARDTAQGRDVALKLLDARGATDWKAYELFERETAVLRSLRHHGVPEVFDAFRAPWEGKDVPFLVMEYVDGTSLGAIIESGRHLQHDEVQHVLLELLSILEYLHGQLPPILHRDIKPANIIIRSNGFPALVDFGSVRRVLLAPDESGSTIAGTYGYMPYEQYMGQASPSSDLYAVAATMLHVTTGRPPKAFMNAHGRIAIPSDLGGGGRFAEVIARMLQPSPADRFQNAREVRQALLSPGTTVAVPGSRAVGGTRVIGSVTLPAAPRALEGMVKERFESVAFAWWRIADSSAKIEDDGYDLWSLGLFGFLCVVTAGIMPAVFVSVARDRRRRLRRFFRDGTPGVAEITEKVKESIAFGAFMTRVHYQFMADGMLRRDSDLTLPIIADRWGIGDQVEILYVPEKSYDSVLVSSE